MGGMMDNIAILAAPASTGRAPEALDRYRSEMEKADRRLLPLRITEVVDGRNRDLGDDYYFHVLFESDHVLVVCDDRRDIDGGDLEQKKRSATKRHKRHKFYFPFVTFVPFCG